MARTSPVLKLLGVPEKRWLIYVGTKIIGQMKK